MSSVDKRYYAEHVVGTRQARETVRIFAFTNRRSGYEVVFSPQRPIMILKSKAPSTPQHPCLHWEPLSTIVHNAEPNATHAVYVVDSSCLTGPEYTALPEPPSTTLGPVLKKLRNSIARLNPLNARLVAAGASSFLAFKYVMAAEKRLGHTDRLVQSLILVCPGEGPCSSMRRLAQIVKNAQGGGENAYPNPEIRVLVQSVEQEQMWCTWLQSLKADGLITDFVTKVFEKKEGEAEKTLFHAVAEICGVDMNGQQTLDEATRLKTPNLFRLDFYLSKKTKNVVLESHESSLNTSGYDDDDEKSGFVRVPEDSDESAGPAPESAPSKKTNPSGEPAVQENEDQLLPSSSAPNLSSTSAPGRHPSGTHELQSDSATHSHPCDGCSDEEEEQWESYGVSELPFLHAPMHVALEGRAVIEPPDATGQRREILETTEGTLEMIGMASLMSENPLLRPYLACPPPVKRGDVEYAGAPVRVLSTLERNEEGQTFFVAELVEKLTRSEAKASLTLPPPSEAPPPYCVSDLRIQIGVLVIRGRKAALVRRPLTENFFSTHPNPRARTSPPEHGYFAIPSEPISNVEESWLGCALRVACDAFDCSSDNFYVPHHIPPLAMYTKKRSEDAAACLPGEEESRVHTRTTYVHVLVTSSGPPGGPASDLVEDQLKASRNFEWLSYQQAIDAAAFVAEKELLEDAQKALRRAYDAGLYRPAEGCGVWGDEVKPLVVSNSRPRQQRTVSHRDPKNP